VFLPGGVLVALDDGAAALADEVLDLEIDGAALVVGAQPEIPAVADDELAARERVADLRGGAAVHVHAVEHGHDAVRPVDRRPVDRTDLPVEPPPGRPLARAVGQALHRSHLAGGRQCPGVEDLEAEPPHEPDDDAGVEVTARLRESQRTGEVDARPGGHGALSLAESRHPRQPGEEELALSSGRRRQA
jgi:hypothetical protein